MLKSPFEVTILIEEHPCEVMRIISSTGLKATVDNVKLGDNATDHIVLFEKEVQKDDLIKLKSHSTKVLKLNDSKVWVRTNGCSVCKILYTSNVVVEKIKVVKERTLLYTLLVPNTIAFKEFLANLTSQGIKFTVLNTSEISSNDLTDRQMEILKLAYKMGYFDDDRRVTLTELAKQLGISAPTLEEIMRRALRKVVKYYLDKVG
ncbi:MAG: helix-turn-helix domain-containing protein [Saccharolobus sp.]|uniref:Bacterio-opsin activator domain-containing protein n=2 Tax=Saccharolobus shibatae TaxID=2286 RepID=A0A8F5BW50_9CREN|nr:helix-turn-helix domain-containing protein [Saccharolobus shibatae]MCH4814699.1 helix-turn-helix domain-containing protein [Saccharolobus shibatae]QXJ29250.1 Bacterio-opsin activator domain-containing protein [Saccharolobus shibatae B12]QXJ32495.1 Bacterio-opsin activator domain-containing protein [Saccharolobus shibatae]QXJ35630.1 Bacterio-opsin activator domain-containing protein [Saccharolobus shibatae]